MCDWYNYYYYNYICELAHAMMLLCCVISLSCRAVDDTPCSDHLDCSAILKNLEELEELQLSYGYVYVLVE